MALDTVAQEHKMIHFVYAFPPDTQEIHSPHCITRNLYNFLKTKTDVKYYDWEHRGVAEVGADDIFIGHPHYDTNTITQRTIREKTCKLMCTIHPLHTALPQHNMPFDDLARKVDKIFSICGPYWYDTIDQTEFEHWKIKITRLDMAVDGSHFPFVRKKFNPIGSRKLVYIGSNMPMKNVDHLTSIMRQMPDVRLHWYGGDGAHSLARLPNVDTTGWIRLGPEMAQQIVDECDIFVNVSNSDANPTTLLESMAWGIITSCTKQSGYWKDPLFTEIFTDSAEASVQNIRKLLNAPDEELMARAIAGRKEIETKYTWSNFCNKIWDELEPYVTT